MHRVDNAVLICLVLTNLVAMKFAPAFVPGLLIALVRYRKASKYSKRRG
jgi:hypothetical protein